MNAYEEKKIDSLQALRGIAALGIMLSHTNFIAFEALGAWGVSVFFVLSGFVLMIAYYGKDRIKNYSVISNMRFTVGKLKKIYFIYIVLTLFMLIFDFVGEKRVPIYISAIKLILNAAFIQEWIPLAERSINGVNWFLCTTALAYFVFPWILWLFEKKYSKKKAVISIVAAILIQFAICVFAERMSIDVQSEWLETDLNYWMVYNAPWARIWDVVIGFNLGYLFVNKRNREGKLGYSLLEIASCLLAVSSFGFYFAHSLLNELPAINKESFLYPGKWWMYVLLFSFGTMVLIYVFAIGKGFVSSLLKNKFLLYIAKLSPYLFLIHYVVYQVIDKILLHLPKELPLYTGPCVKLILGSALSVALTDIYLRIREKYQSKKK